MNKTLNLIVMVFILILTISCSKEEMLTDQQINENIAGKSPEDALRILLTLDQEYPDNATIKANISALYILAEQYDTAGLYLASGRKVVQSKNTSATILGQYLIYANSAAVNLNQGDYPGAINMAMKALDVNPDDPVNSALTSAAAQYVSGFAEEAGSTLAEYWNNRRDSMNPRDLTFFAEILTQGGDYSNALQVYDYLEIHFGYREGIGIKQSILLENLGYLPESLFAVFKDLDYGRFRGVVSGEDVASNLSVMSQEAVSRFPEHEQESIYDILEYMQDYLAGNYYDTITKAEKIEVDAPYYQFIQYASKLSTSPDAETLGRFVEFESLFSNHPGFYHFLWNGMKKGPGEYRFSSTREVLEHVITLSPGSPWSREARQELAFFFGVEQWQKLKTATEQDALVRHIVGEGGVTQIDEMVDMIDLPENPYSDRAKSILVELLGYPQIRSYVESQSQMYSVTQRRVLSALLQS